MQAGPAPVSGTTIRDNVSIGIWAEGSVDITIDRTRVENNASSGLRMFNGPRLTMTNSVVAGNAGLGGFNIATDNGSSQTVITVADSSVSQNTTQGFTVNSTNAGSSVRLAIARSTISRNEATGIFLSANTGTLTAVITDNTIVRNSGNGGISATGAGVSATIAANAISGNSPNGVVRVFALLKTRANNVVQDNTTDVSGTLTFVGGD